MSSEEKHLHYYYNFGESFARRTKEEYKKVEPRMCQSTEDVILVGGGKRHCTFVLKQRVKYAASRTNQYQTPTLKQAAEKESEELMVNVKHRFISKEDVKELFDFTVHKGTSSEGAAPSSKRTKIELCGELSRSEVFCKTLREMVKEEHLIMDSGYVDNDTPPLYSPYHRSKADLYMYHEKLFKRGVVACIANDGNYEEDEDEEVQKLKMVCSGAWEMKYDGKATKQLYAYMLHTGYQIIVKALKEGEIIDILEVYGLSINYEKKAGWLYRLKIDFIKTETVIYYF